MFRWTMAPTGERGAEPGTGQFLKPTKWETNSSVLASTLRTGDQAGFVARHPLALVKAMLAGLKQQMLDDGRFSADRCFGGESCHRRACDDRSRSR